MDKKRRIWAWVAVVFWLGVIFMFSSQPANVSADLSKGVTEVVVRAVARVLDLEVDVSTGEVFARYHGWVRKGAHGLLYFVLALLVMNAVQKSGWRGYGISFAVCVLYAVSDEVHQLYVPGRGGQLGDVLIDSAGALVGLGVYFLAGQFAVWVKRKTASYHE
jgi:VanZ family protein